MQEEFHKNSQSFTLTRRQEQAIQELLNPSSKTIEEVAKKIKVSRRSLYNWLKLPQFKQRLEEEKNKIREEAFDKLKTTLNKAIERLEGLLDSETESIKLRACQIILDHNISLVEIEEIEKRLTKLEEQNKNKQNYWR